MGGRRRNCILTLAAVACLPSSAENWPQFRGPRADGTSLEKLASPLHVLWKVALPGPGHSSPIVWQDRIFLTAFEPDRSVLGAVLGRRGSLLVLALDRVTGRRIWQKAIAAAEIEKTSGINQPASPTPATDGRRVFVYFGSVGLLAFDFDGNQLWENRIGPFPHHMGSGSSPILSEGRVLLNVESDGPSFLYCIDGVSGRTLWRTARKTRQAAYASPQIWNRSVVVAGSERLISYSPDDGREQWSVEGLSAYVVPTPVADGRLLYATSNGPGGGIVLALKPGGEVFWRAQKGAAYVASPVLHNGRLFTANQNCVISCLNAEKGHVVWQQRLSTRGECYASPVVASGVLYLVASSGEVHLLEAGERFNPLKTLDLEEPTYASPAIAGGLLLVRTNRSLIALTGK